MMNPNPDHETTSRNGAAKANAAAEANGTAEANGAHQSGDAHELASLPETKAVMGERDGTPETGGSAPPDGLLHEPSGEPSGEPPAALPPLSLPPLASPFRLPRVALPMMDAKVRRLQLTGLLLSLSVCALLVLQVLHFSHRDDYERVVWENLPLWKTLESWEFSLLDARFVQRGIRVPKSHDKIAIVGMDQKSLTNLDTRNWPRRWHARMIRRLKKAGARVIAMDINFNEHDNARINAKTGAVQLSEDDKALVAATAEAGNVLYPAGYRVQRMSNIPGRPLVKKVTSPFSELDDETPDVAINHIPPHLDGRERRYVVRGYLNGSDIGSYATLAAAIFQNMLDGNENTAYYKVLKAGRWPDLDGVEHTIPLATMDFGDNDRMWTTLIHYWGPAGTFNTYSYSDVLNRYSDVQLREKLGSRIVFVGATADIFKDLLAAPLFVVPGTGSREAHAPQIPGVEVHASVTAMLLDGAYIRAASTAATLWTLFGLALLSSLWTALLYSWISKAARWIQLRWSQARLPLRFNRLRVHSFVWFSLYALLGALPVLLFWQVAKWLFAQQNLWVIVVYPALGAALSSGLMLLLLFGAEAAERRKALTQFSRLVAPDVMEEILAHPEEEYPRPRRVHATVLFTDLEGFTSFSEEHEPFEVVEALNAYLERMRPIVQAHGGSIDKYIGDAIMAFFGVPVPRFDHAAQALHCAIAMQQECARFREETGIPFYMRVGVHTGELIVGSIGSEQHINYTVIGDTVNLASRLESTNKEFGSWIMCSSDTHDAAPDVACVESARTQIKGKSQAVDVFIVRGLMGTPPCDAQWGRASLDPASAVDTTMPALPETATSPPA